MQHLKKIKLIALALLVATVLGTSSVALARDGGSGSGGSDDTVAETDTSGSSTETEHTPEEIEASHPELHKRGSDFVTEMRDKHKPKSAEERKKTCEAHKQGLTKKFSRIVTKSQKMQDRITKFLDKAVAYKTDNNVDVENWDALLAAAQAAQTTSAGSITALEEVTPSIDCNNVSVATDVATFKEAATTTRNNLKSYRSAVKDIFKALKNALESTSDTTTDTNSDTTEGGQQ